MQVFEYWSIDWVSISILLFLFIYFLAFKHQYIRGKYFFWRNCLELILILYFTYESFLWSFIFILLSLIIDLFVRVNHINVNWFGYLSSGLIANFLWDVSKPDRFIYMPHSLEEKCDIFTVWVFVCFDINWLFWFICILFQVNWPIIPLLIFDLCFCIIWVIINCYWYLYLGLI